MIDRAFITYSYALDSDEVKAYLETDTDFETDILKQLLSDNVDESIHGSDLIEYFKDGKIKLLCTFDNWDPYEEILKLTFAFVSENIGVVYNPINRITCRVFLKPNLRHFADCILYIERGTITQKSISTKNKHASTIGRAAVGGAIAGPAGAVVGAISAVDKNNRGGKKVTVTTTTEEIYDIVMLGALEVEGQERYSIIDKIYSDDISLTCLNYHDIWSGIYSIHKRSDRYHYIELKEVQMAYYDIESFADEVWTYLAKIENIHAPAHYRNAENYSDAEIMDIVYEVFCEKIQKECKAKRYGVKLNFCSKEECVVSHIPTIFSNLEFPAHANNLITGWAEFQDYSTGETIRQECAAEITIGTNYNVISCKLKKWPDRSRMAPSNYTLKKILKKISRSKYRVPVIVGILALASIVVFINIISEKAIEEARAAMIGETFEGTYEGAEGSYAYLYEDNYNEDISIYIADEQYCSVSVFSDGERELYDAQYDLSGGLLSITFDLDLDGVYDYPEKPFKVEINGDHITLDTKNWDGDIGVVLTN